MTFILQKRQDFLLTVIQKNLQHLQELNLYLLFRPTNGKVAPTGIEPVSKV